MYITPAQLADRPGALEIAQVATPADEPLVDADLMDATLRGDPQAGSPGEIAIADQALAVVNTAITDAGSLIDGYLANRYELPFTGQQNLLAVWARAIARYLLHKERNPVADDDHITRDYRDALKALQQVAAGKLSLGASDPTAGAAGGGDVAFEPGETVFGRDQMRHY